MQISRAKALGVILLAGCATTPASEDLDASTAWRAAFLQRAADAASPKNNASGSTPFGRPHADAPPGFAQLAFLVGEHSCTTEAPRGVNPHDKEEVVVVPFRWGGEYILDGRAIRDEWADVNSTGMQTRIYDPEADHWSVRWVGISLLEGFGLAQTQGDFVLKAGPDGSVSGTYGEQEYQGAIYKSVITFSEISDTGFEWRLRISKDGDPFGPVYWISCERVSV